MKLVVVWSNGDKEKKRMNLEDAKMLIDRLKKHGAENCNITSDTELWSWNLKHVRSLYFEED